MSFSFWVNVLSLNADFYCLAKLIILIINMERNCKQISSKQDIHLSFNISIFMSINSYDYYYEHKYHIIMFGLTTENSILTSLKTVHYVSISFFYSKDQWKTNYLKLYNVVGIVKFYWFLTCFSFKNDLVRLVDFQKSQNWCNMTTSKDILIYEFRQTADNVSSWYFILFSQQFQYTQED